MLKMKRYYLLNLLLLFAVLNVFSQAGSLDTSFDGDGMRLYDFGTGTDNGYGIVTLPDSSSIILGYADFSGTGAAVLFRMLENSDLDPNFGTDGGYTEIQFGTGTIGYSLLQQPDGKYLVSGTVGTTTTGDNFFVARYLTDGSPDASFNSTGYFISDYSTSNEHCHAMALQPDGKIVLAGRSYDGSYSKLLFARVNSNGTIDASFGTNGYTDINESIQDEKISSVAVLSSGTIVGAGDAYQSNPFYQHLVIMAKIDADGNPMTSFGGNGAFIPSIITDVSHAKKILVVNDSIYMTGYQWDINNNPAMYITKMDSSCVADPAYGTNGITFTQLNNWNIGLDLIWGEDGKLYNSGTTGPSGMASDFVLVRYNADGTYDNSFSTDGIVVTNVRPDWDEAYAIGMQADGKLLLTGMCSGFSTSGDNKIPIVRYLNDYSPYSVEADFEADDTSLCIDGSTTFTDLSNGNITSWNWSFEGGNPPTSTDQNPTVTYSAIGYYDVTLTVSDGTDSDVLLMEDYIQVVGLPDQPDTPAGETELCGSYQTDYTTNPIQYATHYEWYVNPSDAGTITGNTTTATFEASATWTGEYTVKVRAVSDCGDGEWSNELQCEVFFNPEIFILEGDGEFCTGNQGSELTLSGSQIDVDYELFLDGTTTGIVLSGTGNPLSFGFFTDEGIYSSIGSSPGCSEQMTGEIWVHAIDVPETGNTPQGPETVCNDTISDYITNDIADADTVIWVLDPANAGIIYSSGLEATVEWSSAFSGTAYISVYGENECGEGQESDALEINVNNTPSPEVIGPDQVCDNQEKNYETSETSGNTYVWTVTGGEITAGAGTGFVTILWGEPGTGTISVTEETPEGCAAISEEFEVIIDECTGIADNEDLQVIIQPNPTSGKSILKVSKNNVETIEVYHISGRRIFTRNKPAETNLEIDLGEELPGLYFVKIEFSNGVAPQIIKVVRN